jgi:hypothetical protein
MCESHVYVFYYWNYNRFNNVSNNLISTYIKIVHTGCALRKSYSWGDVQRDHSRYSQEKTFLFYGYFFLQRFLWSRFYSVKYTADRPPNSFFLFKNCYMLELRKLGYHFLQKSLRPSRSKRTLLWHPCSASANLAPRNVSYFDP